MKITLKLLLLYLLFSLTLNASWGQSFEFMPGTKRIFMDAQWLKTFDKERHFSLFSRSRATTEYDQNTLTDLFTGAYFNYTTQLGLGGTILGRISSRSSGVDAGLHYFKATPNLSIFALASIQLSKRLAYGWFSIIRFTPAIGEKWRLYTSLELVSNFNADGHLSSIQRIRGGFIFQGYQFGLAINLSGVGRNYQIRDENPGLFFRKSF